MENYQKDHLIDQGLQLDYESNQQLNEASKWSKFLSVLVFVIGGIILIALVIGSTAIVKAFDSSEQFAGLENLGAGVIIALGLIVASVIGVSYYFLFMFATKIKTALATNDAEMLNTAVASLKIFFIISAVISTITLLSTIFSIFNN